MSVSGRTDADGDEHMDSSGSENEQMFPGESGPRTPQQQTSRIAQSTLSPPDSQGPNHFQDTDIIMGSSDQQPAALTMNGKGKQVEEDSKAPGYGWTNAKARDEYEKSFVAVVDRDFGLKEFGELLDQKEVIKATGLKI